MSTPQWCIRVLAATCVGVASSSIYPEGHWERSVALTTDNFDEVARQAAESESTLFVRFASEDCKGCIRQAPAWDLMTSAFQNKSGVIFGDVDMQTAGAGDDNELSQLVKKHKPGEKGWPTIRHFNARTGPQGETYARKLAGKALAEELVTEALLQIYIEEESGDVLCSVATRDGCTDKQIRFISLWCMKSGEEMLAQRERLMAMVGGVMKPALRGWIGERIAILSQVGWSQYNHSMGASLRVHRDPLTADAQLCRQGRRRSACRGRYGGGSGVSRRRRKWRA